jgi:hypothetical protein
MRPIPLWQYNPITGYWKLARMCDPATAHQWLAIYQRDHGANFIELTHIKPKRAPK